MRRRPSRGFGLLEMVVALAIAALAAGAVVWAIRADGPKLALRRNMDTVRDVLVGARREALRAGVDVDVIVDPRVGAVGGRVMAPCRVDWHDPGTAVRGDGTAAIRFHAGGGSSGGVMTLRCGAHGARVDIGWLIGRVRTVEDPHAMP